MKKQQDLPGGTGSTRAVFVSRWLFSGAFLGLLIGLAEAARLWTAPRVIPLLVPDVGWVIWFLAPLVGPFPSGLAAGNPSRIVRAQAFFEPDNSEPVRPTQSERDAMRSLPYQ